MKRTVAVVACGLSLAGCSGLPSMSGFSLGGPPTTSIQFESQPPGAEARTSTGQTCRTPCTQDVAATEFTVTFTLNGYQQQTVPVRISASTEAIDPQTGIPPAPRMVPNPVFAELQPVPPPPPPRRRAAPAKPRTTSQPAAAPQRSAAPPPPPPPAAPAPAPAAAWPPPPPAR